MGVNGGIRVCKLGGTEISFVTDGGIGNCYLDFTYSLASTGSLVLKECAWAASGASSISCLS